MLAIVTWLWGNKYSAEDVRKLARGVTKNVQQSFGFIVVTDKPEEFELDRGIRALKIPDEDIHLTNMKGCFARLRLFDPVFQEKIYELVPGFTRILNMDLDSVVTGVGDKNSGLDALVNRPEDFVILKGANATNPCPYNGSLWMIRRNVRPDVWNDFGLDRLGIIPKYEFPDDQGWFWLKFGDNAPNWEVGARSGVYAFQKPGWPKGENLPAQSRLVVFPGWRSPTKFAHLPWIKENWR